MHLGRLIICTIFLSFSAFSQDDEYLNQVQQLDWKGAVDSYELPSSDAKITISENEYLVLGKDAHKFMLLTEGHDGFKPDAVKLKIHTDESESTAIYQRYDIGFVKTDDWEENIDSDEMLAEIIQGTEETNKIRAEGHAKLYIDGWAQTPFLDKENLIIYWAINGHTSENTQFINAKALKLGRKGYTEVIWAGSPEQFTNAEAVLEPVLASYTYNEGFQYDDFMPETDTVAAMGAGALVYKLATGKAAVKAGFLAAAAIFAKKFWFIIFLPFVYGWKWIKRKFSGKSE
ncbi:Uncharacterized membrane-anchored protein [Marisediminitalea aggregata]|uniref:Uncharacterized membrane-anchored protein n=1 Tax=Marisediminitalea aggregata TaxID=634436 RepID=A0A1M5QHV3_9ALTE|nr:DUF2167 domain-containing protein [Marisediminitalea aggregata]SHH13486.1 Uncharacterized membrane-anchored protein [Marisediminitalea aggregata]